MTEYRFNERAYSNLAEDIDNTQTTITLIKGGGNTFLQEFTENSVLALTLVSPSKEYEIVHVTNIEGDVLTVQRQQEGTSARSWPVGTMITQRLTADALSNFIQKEGFRTFTSSPNGVYECLYVGEKAYVSTQEAWWIARGGAVWDCLTYPCIPHHDLTRLSPLTSSFCMPWPLSSADANGNAIIAVCLNGYMKSYDGGDTWEVDNYKDVLDEDAREIHIAAGNNNVWVVASYAYRKYSEDDGKTWNDFSWDAGYTEAWIVRRTKFLNNQFIAIGSKQVVQVSSNGSIWTKKYDGGSTYAEFQDIEYDGSTYVAVGRDANGETVEVWSSSDLETWTRKANVSTNAPTFASIAYGAGKWVLASGNGAYYSTDLVNWTKVSVSHDLYRIRFLNSIFVATVIKIGDSTADNTICYTSTDGTSWTARTATPYLSDIKAYKVYDIAYANSKFFVFGGSSSENNKALGSIYCYSNDAISWTNPQTPRMNYKGDFRAGYQDGPITYIAGTEPPAHPISGTYPLWDDGWDIHRLIGAFEIFKSTGGDYESWTAIACKAGQSYYPSEGFFSHVYALTKAWGRLYACIERDHADLDTGSYIAYSTDEINWLPTGVKLNQFHRGNSMQYDYGYDLIFATMYDPTRKTPEGEFRYIVFDSNHSWRVVPGPGGRLSGVAVYDSANKIIVATDSNGISHQINDDPLSENGGTWTTDVSGGDGIIVLAKSDGSGAWAITKKNEVYYCEDSITSWSKASLEAPVPDYLWALNWPGGDIRAVVGEDAEVQHTMTKVSFDKKIIEGDFTGDFYIAITFGAYPQGYIIIGGEEGELQALPMECL